MIRSRNKTTHFQELLKVIEAKKSGGGGGGSGTVNSIVAGDNITVDNTDPENPEISADVGVKDLTAGSAKVLIDKTNPANPKIDVTGFLEDVESATARLTIDKTNPEKPLLDVNGFLEDITSANSKLTIDKTIPEKPSLTVSGFLEDVIAGANITIDKSNPAKPIINATGGGGGGSSLQSHVERIVIDNTILTNKEVTMPFTINEPSKIQVTIWGGVLQMLNVDYVINGNTISWAGLALEILLNNTDVLVVTYVGN